MMIRMNHYGNRINKRIQSNMATTYFNWSGVVLDLDDTIY